MPFIKGWNSEDTDSQQPITHPFMVWIKTYDKRSVVYPEMECYSAIKKEWSTEACCAMGKPWMH